MVVLAAAVVAVVTEINTLVAGLLGKDFKVAEQLQQVQTTVLVEVEALVV
jgi:hypothetical protein